MKKMYVVESDYNVIGKTADRIAADDLLNKDIRKAYEYYSSDEMAKVIVSRGTSIADEVFASDEEIRCLLAAPGMTGANKVTVWAKNGELTELITVTEKWA